MNDVVIGILLVVLVEMIIVQSVMVWYSLKDLYVACREYWMLRK